MGLVFFQGIEGMAKGSWPVVVQTGLGSWIVKKWRTGRMLETFVSLF